MLNASPAFASIPGLIIGYGKMSAPISHILYEEHFGFYYFSLQLLGVKVTLPQRQHHTQYFAPSGVSHHKNATCEQKLSRSVQATSHVYSFRSCRRATVADIMRENRSGSARVPSVFQNGFVQPIASHSQICKDVP